MLNTPNVLETVCLVFQVPAVFVVKVNLSLRSPAWPSAVEKWSQVDKSALPCSVWREYAPACWLVSKRYKLQPGETFKKHRGLLSSRQEWYGLNCSYLVSKYSLISRLVNSPRLQVNKHKNIQNLLVFVLMSNNDKDRQVSCLVTWRGKILRISPAPSVISGPESCRQGKAAALWVNQIEMRLYLEA